MTSGHYGYWCVTCNAPIKDGEQVIDLPHGVAHAACHCAVCKAPIDECPHGGDCGEIDRVYRETQREKLRDIDLRDIHCDICGLDYESATHDECR